MTSLAEELAEQQRWKLLPHCAAIKGFDRLIENEFTPPERVEVEEASALTNVVRFAVARVPYYRDLFKRLGLRADDIAGRQDLPRLPLLTKRELLEQFDNLRSEALPPGETIWGVTSSSGSTGPPTKVVHSAASNVMFTFLSQRNSRWFRHDPRRTMASIRSARANLKPRPGVDLPDGETLQIPRWRYVGLYFETGPSLYFNITTPVEAQIAWLRREHPDYLLMTAQALPHLAMACTGERPCDSLRAINAISEPLTPATRRHLEAIYGARIHQAYGLNEIGLVAVRCEAGRYHVHREHCVVEIIDDAGNPCPPGRAGRVVVTGLSNAAMPLIRYDADDLAIVTDGPCPCGRTLPSFGEVLGRYSRLVGLPAGTLDRAAVVRTALQAMPADLVRGLRRYQIHHLRDGRFELRLVTVSPIPKAFGDRVHQAWAIGVGETGPPLTIRSVPEIPYKTAGGKFEDFVSELSPGSNPAATEERKASASRGSTVTSLAEEQAEQQRWKLLPHCAAIKDFDHLVENEFTPPERVKAEEASALVNMVRFAVAHVPYYRDLFRRLGLTADDIAGRQDLPRLPLLTKRELREQFDELRPEALPPGVKIWGIAASSGSTGPPTKVVHSVASNSMFTFLTQRHNRWARRDPMRTMASIRLASANMQPTPGRDLADGETLRVPRWRYVGVYFETGPSLYFNITNPVETQLAWLRGKRPDYLLMRSHALEHLAMACAGERPCDSLLGVQAISEPITLATRRHFETVYGAPVNQAYGLNEIGLVAVRCEAERYHVHREHCVVEVLDEAGQPCQPGFAGRIVVTGLQNAAMPLLRYDADDLATATAGPCPCGRTLPSFGEIHGRYSRLAGLPKGTLDRVSTLRTALQRMPIELARGLRRYQIRQFRDGRFELRLASATAVPAALCERLQLTWSSAVGTSGGRLEIRTVADIPLATVGDKFDDFVSEYC